MSLESMLKAAYLKSLREEDARKHFGEYEPLIQHCGLPDFYEWLYGNEALHLLPTRAIEADLAPLVGGVLYWDGFAENQIVKDLYRLTVLLPALAKVDVVSVAKQGKSWKRLVREYDEALAQRVESYASLCARLKEYRLTHAHKVVKALAPKKNVPKPQRVYHQPANYSPATAAKRELRAKLKQERAEHKVDRRKPPHEPLAKQATANRNKLYDSPEWQAEAEAMYGVGTVLTSGQRGAVTRSLAKKGVKAEPVVRADKPKPRDTKAKRKARAKRARYAKPKN